MMYAGTKNWNEAITVVTTEKKMVGVSSGRITCRNCCRLFAPSMRAASLRCSGMCCRPAT